MSAWAMRTTVHVWHSNGAWGLGSILTLSLQLAAATSFEQLVENNCGD